MRIGVDLDGVIYNSENWIFAMAELQMIHQNKKQQPDRTSSDIQVRYHMTEKEAFEFRKKFNPQQILHAPLMPFALEALQELKQQCHEIFIITNRGKIFSEHIALTNKRLQKDGVLFDEIHFCNGSKTETCKACNIDVMIDDNFQVVSALAKEGIRCIQFKADSTKKAKHKNIQIAYNWGEVIALLQK